jgi:hypothetical protein
MRKLGLVGFSGLYAIFLLAHCVGDESDITTTPGTDSGGGGSETGTTGSDSSTSGGNDSSVTDSAIADTGPDVEVDAGPPCDLAKPFGLVKPLPGDVNSAAEETYGRMTDNGLELYFIRKSTTAKVFRATRAKVGDPWSGSAEVAVLNQSAAGVPAEVRAPTLTGDSLTIFLQTYDGANAGVGNIYTSTRASASAPGWSVPTIVPNVNGTGADDGPYITRNGLHLYYFRGPAYHVVLADRASLAVPFNAPTSGIFTGNAEDRNAVLSDDELTGFFSNYTLPPLGAGAGPQALRTYVSTRASTGVAFTTAAYSEVNVDSSITEPTWLSKNGCTSMLHSPRPGGAGSYDLYYSDRPK